MNIIKTFYWLYSSGREYIPINIRLCWTCLLRGKLQKNKNRVYKYIDYIQTQSRKSGIGGRGGNLKKPSKIKQKRRIQGGRRVKLNLGKKQDK